MNITIIGLGGIGSIVANNLSRFLNYFQTNDIIHITLIDGDRYEITNKTRQEFDSLGMKADVKKNELSSKFPRIAYDSICEYVTDSNVADFIKEEEDACFLCVDNHRSRKTVSDYCEKMKSILLISGGNELTDGNVQIFYREGGISRTPSLTAYHKEIQNPADKNPADMSCEELSHSEPQLFFTNMGVAFFMLAAFYNILTNNTSLKSSEVYFDMLSLKADAKIRQVK